MKIGGLQKLTLIDYPGKIACAVFTIGCNFRCPFCHNPELVESESQKVRKSGSQGVRESESISEQEFFDFLKARQGLLDGVCVTGGEPLLHHDLPEFLRKIKNLGFLVKLDTNGASPDKLAALIKDNLVDYVAMDVKAPIKSEKHAPYRNEVSDMGLKVKSEKLYEKVCGVKINLEDIKKSIQIIMSSGLDYEFRTTVAPGLHAEADILEIAKEIRGAKKYYLQQFVAGEKLLDAAFREVKPYPIEFLRQIRDKIKDFFEICEIRG